MATSTDFLSLAAPHVGALHAYTPGLQPVGPGWTKLNTNENPYPPSPRVAEALRREIGEDAARLRLYPNPTSAPLREAVAALHGLKVENVLIGNGSDDVLNLLVRVFGGGAAGVADTLPSYSLYPVLVGIENGRMIRIEFDRSMRLPVDAILASGATLFFLTTPNAPTGVAFPLEDLRRLAEAFPGILVYDEAYVDFAEHSCAAWVAELPRLVVTRTLSKSYSLAGIRCGYALGSPELIDLLDRVRDSYNVNRLTQAAALAALEDSAHHAECTRRIKATREATRAALEAWGWFVYPSASNFLFAEPRDAAGRAGPEIAGALYRHLTERKVLVRHFGTHALTAGFLRITVGTDQEMQTFMEAADSWRTHA